MTRYYSLRCIQPLKKVKFLSLQKYTFIHINTRLNLFLLQRNDRLKFTFMLDGRLLATSMLFDYQYLASQKAIYAVNSRERFGVILPFSIPIPNCFTCLMF